MLLWVATPITPSPARKTRVRTGQGRAGWRRATRHTPARYLRREQQEGRADHGRELPAPAPRWPG